MTSDAEDGHAIAFPSPNTGIAEQLRRYPPGARIVDGMLSFWDDGREVLSSFDSGTSGQRGSQQPRNGPDDDATSKTTKLCAFFPHKTISPRTTVRREPGSWAGSLEIVVPRAFPEIHHQQNRGVGRGDFDPHPNSLRKTLAHMTADTKSIPTYSHQFRFAPKAQIVRCSCGRWTLHGGIRPLTKAQAKTDWSHHVRNLP